MSDYSWAFSPNVYNFTTVDKIDAEVELEQVHNFLEKAGIKHWVSAGTLLGIYRDGKFLEDDTDIDFGIMGKDVKNIQDVIPWEFERSVFDETITDKTWQSFFTSPRNVAIDLMWFWEEGDNIVNKNDAGFWVKPKERMEEFGTLEFKGVKYPVPEPEWYLKHRFKDWETRIHKNGKMWWDFAGDFLK